MKKEKKLSLLLMLMMITAIVLLPSSGMAYQNAVEGALGFGAGDSASTDITARYLEIQYTRFLTDVTSGEGPYGVDEFLQHPNYVGGGIISENFEVEAKIGGNKSDEDSLFTGVEGMYYVRGGEMATGLGLRLATGTKDTDDYVAGVWFNSDEEDVRQLTFSVNQYLKKDLRLEFSIADENLEGNDSLGGTWEYDQRVISAGASALLQDKFWLSGRLKNGERDWQLTNDQDIEGIELTFGFYPDQKIGAFVHIGKETIDSTAGDTDTSTFALEGDFYFNANMHLDATLTMMNIDPPGPNDADITGLDIAFGYMF